METNQLIFLSLTWLNGFQTHGIAAISKTRKAAVKVEDNNPANTNQTRAP